MRTTLNIVDNNITYENGDSLILNFSEAFSYVDRFNWISFSFSPLNTVENGHDIHFRWSYDLQTWAAWQNYQINEGLIEWENKITEIVNERIPFYLQFRFTRRGTDGIARTLTQVVVDFEQGNAPEAPFESPFSTGTCTANTAATTNFCSGVNMNCDPQSIYRPYDTMGPAIKLFEDLNCTVSEMFGHCVRYFRVDPESQARDVVLKEYSMHSVVDVKDIKVMVPDNEFPDEAFQYMPFDMEFQNGFEIQILRSSFELVFGQGKRPQEKDFLYFPFTDRLYTVNSAYLPRQFMGSQPFYKVMLYKWQDEVAVLRKDATLDSYVDNLTDDFQEILQEEIDQEFEKVTKTKQYKSIAVGGYDHVRSTINEDLIIREEDLENYFTIISKYYYDLNTPSTDEVALTYKLQLNEGPTSNTAFSMWINPGNTGSTAVDTIISGMSGSTGMEIKIQYGASGSSVITESMIFSINGTEHTFSNIPNMMNSWYGIVINHMNEFDQLNVNIWSIKPVSSRTSNLTLEYTQTIDITPTALSTPVNLFVPQGMLKLTNIRVWNESIEEEKQANILNQYIVRDSHKALLIDNAIPPLRMIRQDVR